MDVGAFLGKHPPFDSLAPEQLERIWRSVRIEFFPEGAVVIQAAGEPAPPVRHPARRRREIRLRVGVFRTPSA